jgi:hypothetical protein
MSYGYVPPPSPPLPLPRAAPKDWFSTNWKWFVPTILLGLVLVLALFVGGVVTFVFGLMKSSEPYQHAVAIASSNPHVVRELGRPLVPGWYVTGNINLSGTSGQADMAIPLKGTLRRGTVYVVAKKTNGVWTYSTLQMLVDGDGFPIELLPAPATSSPKEDK